MILDAINSNRNIDKLELNGRNNVQLDDELLFWINIEDEYFGKVDNKLEDILKFHINSSEYILSTINDILGDKKDEILMKSKSFDTIGDDSYSSSCLVLNGGLDEWNKINNNPNTDGYGLYDVNDGILCANGFNSSDLQKDNESKLSNCGHFKRIKNIKLTLNIPPLYKPTDFPKELNQCSNVKDILSCLFKIQCMNKYTALNNSRNLYNINDKIEEFQCNSNRDTGEFVTNRVCNYICMIPDIITGPNTTYNCYTNSNSLYIADYECRSDITEHIYNFNDISDKWIFNINNSEINLDLRKRLLDTNNSMYNDVNLEKKNSSKIEEDIEGNKILVKSIIGSEEYIMDESAKYFNIDENKLISVFDDGSDYSSNNNLNTDNITRNNSGVSRINKLKSFGDFFQDNINISPNISTTFNEQSRNNLSSILNSNVRIDFSMDNSVDVGIKYEENTKSTDIQPSHLKSNTDLMSKKHYYQHFLNRIGNLSLEDVSRALIRRLEDISMRKIRLFKLILERIDNEKEVYVNYWLKKEYELSSYYRNRQYELNNYNYTLEKQSKDLEIYRLGCIESKYLPSEWQETAICSICGNDTDWDEDPIYFCDGCYQPAHHSCVNPKQPFKYNSTRMLNVIERERKCKEGDFDSENLNVKNRTEQNVEDDDQWWLCDSCLYIKSELLEHQCLFFVLIRMISGPRNSDSYKYSCKYIQKNSNLFLQQLVNYNVLSSNTVFKGSYCDSDTVVVFPWVKDWKFPVISEHDLSEKESNDNEHTLIIPPLERRKGRPRKTPLLTLNKPVKSSYCYFTFDFEDLSKKSSTDSSDYCEDDSIFFLNEWIPSVDIPYNLADFKLLDKQIFNPVKWYTKLNHKIERNKTPPVSILSTTPENSKNINLEIEKFTKLNSSCWSSKQEDKNDLFDLYKHDLDIIEKLKSRKIIEHDDINNKYKIHVKVPICQLCGYDSYCRGGGIMKRTVDGYWSHIRCALGNNSVLSNDGNYVRIKIDLNRNKLKCEGCGKIDSSPILCYNNKCFRYYHINCASSIKGCIVDWENGKPIFYCPEHASYIAPTLLLRKYQLSNFNKWFYGKYNHSGDVGFSCNDFFDFKYEGESRINKINKNNSADININIEGDIKCFGIQDTDTEDAIVGKNRAVETRDIKNSNVESGNIKNTNEKSIFGNIFSLPLIVRQTFLADLRDDTRTVIFIAKLLKTVYDSNGINLLKKDNITPTPDFNINSNNEVLFNSFSKFHLYLPELVYVQSADTVISRLSTPWSGNIDFWIKTLNNNILNSFGINSIYNINQYKYFENSKLITTCVFNTMELLLNRLINPYEIRLIALIISSKMGSGPWFSLFYYWKFIPLTFYYNIIKNNDLSMLEPLSNNSQNDENYEVAHGFSCQEKNLGYHLQLFGFRYLSIEKLDYREAHLKSINSCYSIISKNWNYCCQICNSVCQIFCGQASQLSDLNDNYLCKCKVCNSVICFNCNNLYDNVMSIQDSSYGFMCERCLYFRSKKYDNVIRDSCCCLCSRFDNILIRIKKGTYINFQNNNGNIITVKPRRTLLSDGSVALDENFRLTEDIWLHPICIEWLTNYSKNQSNLIQNLISIEKKYFNNSCKYCGLNNGVSIKCSFNSCNTHFHVSCGKSIGCKFDYSKYKNKQHEQYYNTINSSVGCNFQQYRRSWCLFHNQFCNNSNSNGDLLGGGNNRNSVGNTNINLQDIMLLRTLYNNIIENNNNTINNGDITNDDNHDENANANINISYSISQNNNDTLLKMGLLNYYGLNMFEDFSSKVKKNQNLSDINIYNDSLFSKNIQIKNNVNNHYNQDILYISKWEDLIQILCYDVISRFIYGIGFPKQRYVNTNPSRKKSTHNQNKGPSPNLSNSIINIKDNIHCDIRNNICIACDKLYKREWSLLYLDWIFCDSCKNWFHWCCLGLNKDSIPKDNEPYRCMFCLGFKKSRGRKRKTLINPLELNVASVFSSSFNNNFQENRNDSKNVADSVGHTEDRYNNSQYREPCINATHGSGDILFSSSLVVNKSKSSVSGNECFPEQQYDASNSYNVDNFTTQTEMLVQEVSDNVSHLLNESSPADRCSSSPISSLSNSSFSSPSKSSSSSFISEDSYNSDYRSISIQEKSKRKRKQW